MHNRIREVRKDAKLTQTEFGKRIGVKGNTVTNYENGLRTPSDAVILAICKEFSINEEWLRTGAGLKKVDVNAKIAAYFGNIITGGDDTILDIIETYMELDSTSKAVIKNVIDLLVEKRMKRGK